MVTGGCGYFGFYLGDALHHMGAEVVLADVQLPPRIQKCLTDTMTFVKVEYVLFLIILKSKLTHDILVRDAGHFDTWHFRD